MAAKIVGDAREHQFWAHVTLFREGQRHTAPGVLEARYLAHEIQLGSKICRRRKRAALAQPIEEVKIVHRFCEHATWFREG